MVGVYSTLSRSDSASVGRQSYEEILVECRATGRLFVDPEFSPNENDPEISWSRPTNISRAPEFIADGVSRFDVKQGQLGDCWLIAAMANLTLNKELFDRVVPPGQTFERGHYCGAFRFNFWQFGKWVEVIVDDRLPVDQSGDFKFVHSSDHNEFWSPLLEKAYAKLYSSYKCLEGGSFCEAMVDFTGGIAESLMVQNPPPEINVWKILKVCHERGSMMGCSILNRNRYDAIGIVSCHAYSITMVAEFHPEGSETPLRMLRLRNPWGEREWKGEWNDNSAKWLDISKEEKKRIGFTVRDDGEFWIPFDKWRNIFTNLEVCNLSPESVNNDAKHRWYSKLLAGNWCMQSGGHLTWSREFQFATNPQYLLELTKPDVDDPKGNCTLIVTLSQKDRRQNSDGVSAGFYVYAAPRNQATRLGGRFFKNNGPLIYEPRFSYDRDVTTRFHLAPGSYLIVPATREVGEGGEFMLRFWTEHEISCAELTGGGDPIAQPMTCNSAASVVEKSHRPVQVYAKPPAQPSTGASTNNSNITNIVNVGKSVDINVSYPTLGSLGEPTILVQQQPVAQSPPPQISGAMYKHKPRNTTIITTSEVTQNQSRSTLDIINKSGRASLATNQVEIGDHVICTGSMIDSSGKLSLITVAGKYKDDGQLKVKKRNIQKIGYVAKPAQKIRDKNGVEKLVEETVIERGFVYPKMSQVPSDTKKRRSSFFRKFILCAQSD